MTDRQKLTDLPQEQREELVQKASQLGINTAMIANWYVDTLETKIAELEAKKNDTANTENKDDAATDAAKNDAPEDATETDTAKDDAVDENGNIDPNTEAEQLNKDTEKKPKVNQKKAAAKNEVKQICHICRSVVINGKCTGCGFTFSRGK